MKKFSSYFILVSPDLNKYIKHLKVSIDSILIKKAKIQQPNNKKIDKEENKIKV